MHIQPWHLRKLNLILTVIIIALASVAFFLRNDQKKEIEIPPPENISSCTLPQSFTLDEKSYGAIGEPFLHLEQGLAATKLPDLRNLLISYGVILRPDVPKDKAKFLIGIRGQHPPESFAAGEKIYLVYNCQGSYNRWNFSPENGETPIWVTLEMSGNQVAAHVKMKDPQGNEIEGTQEQSFFVLPEMSLQNAPDSLAGWKVGSILVDHTFLEKQRARWYGKDLFLDLCGGNDYKALQGCERIEFDGDKGHYSVWVHENGLLAFDEEEGFWKAVEPGKDSEGKALLQATKILDQTISFDLWEPEGQRKLVLELRRSPDATFASQELNIKLVGARSRQDWITEIQGVRSLVRSDDWILFHDGKFEKLTKTEQLDAYLHGALIGELVVLNGTKKIGSQQALVGTRFNSNRTQAQDITISMNKVVEQPQNSPDEDGRKAPKKKTARHEKFEDEEEDMAPFAMNDEDDDDDEEEDDEDDDE